MEGGLGRSPILLGALPPESAVTLQHEDERFTSLNTH